MEFKELLNAYMKEKNLIVGLVMVGMIVSLVIYLIPAKYVSEGTLIVTRKVQGSSEFFTYEGYYAQQTAALYTGTIEPLLDSIDVRRSALDKLGWDVDEITLRKLKRDTRIKREGNQLVVLQIKDKDKNIAEKKWYAIADSLIETSKLSNKKSDPELDVAKISMVPVTKPVYRSIWVYLMAGVLGGLLFGVSKVSISEYYKRS